MWMLAEKICENSAFYIRAICIGEPHTKKARMLEVGGGMLGGVDLYKKKFCCMIFNDMTRMTPTLSNRRNFSRSST